MKFWNLGKNKNETGEKNNSFTVNKQEFSRDVKFNNSGGIGMHVSTAGSIDIAVDNAIRLGCSAFQIFTRNPRGWKASPLSNDVITNFREKLAASKIDRYSTAADMPYLPNLSSPDDDPFSKSLNVLIDEIRRCSKLGIPFLITRFGTHKGAGDKIGIERFVGALSKAARDTSGDVMILLENSLGYKNSIGSTIEQLSSIFLQLKDTGRFGICFDTCHAFVAGYDLRTETSVSSTLEKFDKEIGFKHLMLLHLNDSKAELGYSMDGHEHIELGYPWYGHEHIGLGKIGEKGLGYIAKFAHSKKIPIILETPIDERRDDFGNIKKARELLSS